MQFASEINTQCGYGLRKAGVSVSNLFSFGTFSFELQNVSTLCFIYYSMFIFENHIFHSFISSNNNCLVVQEKQFKTFGKHFQGGKIVKCNSEYSFKFYCEKFSKTDRYVFCSSSSHKIH